MRQAAPGCTGHGVNLAPCSHWSGMGGMSLPFRSFRVSPTRVALFRGQRVLAGLSVATWMADALGGPPLGPRTRVVEARDGDSVLSASSTASRGGGGAFGTGCGVVGETPFLGSLAGAGRRDSRFRLRFARFGVRSVEGQPCGWSLPISPG
jgi:hypothetical protein